MSLARVFVRMPKCSWFEPLDAPSFACTEGVYVLVIFRIMYAVDARDDMLQERSRDDAHEQSGKP